MNEIITSHYKCKDFPSDEVMKKNAMSCPLLAHCPDRTFSFCLKECVRIGEDKLMYRKVTFKHCHECMNDIE